MLVLPLHKFRDSQEITEILGDVVSRSTKDGFHIEVFQLSTEEHNKVSRVGQCRCEVDLQSCNAKIKIQGRIESIYSPGTNWAIGKHWYGGDVTATTKDAKTWGNT